MMSSGWIPPVWLLAMVLMSQAVGQQVIDCPRDWMVRDGNCYKFIIQPQLTFQEADIACRRQHATLISVTDAGENAYVRTWLMTHDIDRQEWLTSGTRRGDKFIWTSDGSEITNFYFLSDAIKNERRLDARTDIENKQILFRYNENTKTYYWNWGRIMKPASYICKVLKQNVWKFYHRKRDFSFGTGEMDPLKWPVAPNITKQSQDIVFFMRLSGAVTPVTLDCVAEGNPQPSYRWFRQYPGGLASVLQSSSHYAITNGKLYIQYPNPQTDAAAYLCEASNQHGTVYSNPIQLTYGSMDEFSNVPTADYTSRMYMGIEIDCQPPTYKPAARFNWFKGSSFQSVRPELNPQTFLSRNGRLYISEVAPPDAGNYFCAIQLAARPGERLASSQTLSRNSLPIKLTVSGDSVNTYGPDIQDKFPQVFPKVPLVGQRMMIECLAYGRLPLVYDWVRDDAPMNPKAYKTDANRVLIIEEALLQDTGAYTCIVRGQRSSMNRTRYIKMSGVPRFPIPLENQFVDKDSSFVWTCFAQGVPEPIYRWYKDGQLLGTKDDGLGMTVHGRHLTFKSINEKYNGAYDCEAENSLGSRRSSAQLRVVSFKPSFTNSPVVSSLYATAGGRITIQCQPEAAPRAMLTWRRPGGGGLGSNGFVLPNGALELQDLSVADTGTYVCEATNNLGGAESSVVLTVSDKTILTEQPETRSSPMNGSATLRCKASYDRSKSDVVYSWKFYDHLIDFNEDFSYSMPFVDQGSGALYVISAQYHHEGVYTCMASTVTDTVSASGYLTVTGPPEPPAAVHKHDMSDEVTGTNLELWWTPGRTHEFPITHYTVEAKADMPNEDWVVVKKDISEEDSKVDVITYHNWRRTVLSGVLSPGTAYHFRVRAKGAMGYSPPSLPSPVYKMEDAAPIYAPSNVGGGGGKERELRITWEPLPQSKWGANHIRYIVYWRMKAGNSRINSWQKTGEMTNTAFYHIVSQENYYTPYDVKVQAVNDIGKGPNSTLVVVLSAELMPNVVPSFSQANAINSTAGTVEWLDVPNTRERVYGSIHAFQVNYWQENTKCIGDNELQARFTRVYGDVTSATLVGLEPGADYCVNIQLLNNAGLGPKSSNFYLGMNDPAPQRWPEYVTISSHGPDSVRVTWKGVVNRFGEAPLQGYKAWYWKRQQDVRYALKRDFGRSFTGVIKGIERDAVYRLRMVAYNSGGDGKKAPDVMFTLGGLVNYNPLTTEVMNIAPCLMTSLTTCLLCLTVFLCKRDVL